MQFCKILFVDCICKYNLCSVSQKALLAHPTTLKYFIDLTTLKHSGLGKFTSFFCNLFCCPVKWHFLICSGKICSFQNLFRMSALHTSCQLAKLFWMLLWLQRIIYWTAELVKLSRKLQCKAVTNMILLKILYRNVILQEQTGLQVPPVLEEHFPSPWVRWLTEMCYAKTMWFSIALQKVFLSTVVKCQYKTFLWWGELCLFMLCLLKGL